LIDRTNKELILKTRISEFLVRRLENSTSNLHYCHAVPAIQFLLRRLGCCINADWSLTTGYSEAVTMLRDSEKALVAMVSLSDEHVPNRLHFNGQMAHETLPSMGEAVPRMNSKFWGMSFTPAKPVMFLERQVSLSLDNCVKVVWLVPRRSYAIVSRLPFVAVDIGKHVVPGPGRRAQVVPGDALVVISQHSRNRIMRKMMQRLKENESRIDSVLWFGLVARLIWRVE
jgi:hypothetical protein